MRKLVFHWALFLAVVVDLPRWVGGWVGELVCIGRERRTRRFE